MEFLKCFDSFIEVWLLFYYKWIINNNKLSIKKEKKLIKLSIYIIMYLYTYNLYSNFKFKFKF